ncbi:MAG: GNAT family N-acetyltransferase [Ruminococcaceae bacterium]|mgnify:CR=1 FL=1|nr:GNAT family N-acetyltransferase [Oscillospiraceae bacterium]
MIRKISIEEIPVFAEVIRRSFKTVADDFGLTKENAPTNGAFLKDEKLIKDFNNKENMMFGYFLNGVAAGYFNLSEGKEGAYGLRNLAVLPEYRNRGIAGEMIDFARKKVMMLGGNKISIGIIEENTRLKKWYEKQGFIHKGAAVLSHLPFTVGFMEMPIP